MATSEDWIVSPSTKEQPTKTTGQVDTLAEQVIYTLLLVVIIVWTFSSNISLIVVLRKYKIVTVPNQMVRIAIALLDLATCFSSGVLMPIILSKGLGTPEKLCEVLSTINISAVSSNMCMTALLAIERYLYIAFPLKYPNLMTLKSMFISVSAIFIIPAVYSGATSIIFGRRLFLSVFMCQMGSPVGTLIAFVLFLFPALSTTLVILILMTKLRMKLMSNKITPANTSDTNIVNSASNSSVVTKKAALQAIKMVSLVSGTLWLSYIPAYLTRMFVSRRFAWYELETRSTEVGFILMRLSTVGLCVVSSALNPLIQFLVEDDIKVGFLKLIGRDVVFSWQRSIREAVVLNNV